MSLVSYVLALIALPLVVVLFLPALSELAGYVSRRRSPSGPSDVPAARAVRLAILVPAHNEEAMIARCVRSLVGMSRVGVDFDVVVIADNCSDTTASVAAAHGARVLERTDVTLPGKPHAIRWAMDQLHLTSYDAVVIVDADSIVESSYASALAARAPLTRKAVQSFNGVANRAGSWLSRLAGLLIAVRYDGQFVHKGRSGLNCPLANGMLMGTEVLEELGWPVDSLTENWEVYARFTAAGVPIEYAPAARLGSQQAEGLSQSSVQRRRWQAGRWQVLREYFGPLMRSRSIGSLQKLDALAELTAPGPVVHASFATGIAVLLLLFPSPLGYVLIAALIASLLPLVAWTIWAIRREEDRGQLVLALARLPFYAMWRVVILLRSITVRRRGVWTRSPRHSIEVP